MWLPIIETRFWSWVLLFLLYTTIHTLYHHPPTCILWFWLLIHYTSQRCHSTFYSNWVIARSFLIVIMRWNTFDRMWNSEIIWFIFLFLWSCFCFYSLECILTHIYMSIKQTLKLERKASDGFSTRGIQKYVSLVCNSAEITTQYTFTAAKSVSV